MKGDIPSRDEIRYELKLIGKFLVDNNQGFDQLQTSEPYYSALPGLGSCIHDLILCWADQMDNPSGSKGELVVELPYAPGVRTDVLTNRSEAQPNPTVIISSYLVDVNEQAGTADLVWIDASNSSLLLDIKPCLPMADRVMEQIA